MKNEDQGWHNLKRTFVNAASLKTSGVGYYKKGDLRHPIVVDIGYCHNPNNRRRKDFIP